MKKVIITMAAVLMAGFLSASAHAWGCGGMYGNGYHGSCYNGRYNQAFYNETKALRSSIAADRAEIDALMAGTNPDPDRVRALSEQISRSEEELRSKARQYNVAGNMGPGMMHGYNQGWNCGIAGHDHAFAGCW